MAQHTGVLFMDTSDWLTLYLAEGDMADGLHLKGRNAVQDGGPFRRADARVAGLLTPYLFCIARGAGKRFFPAPRATVNHWGHAELVSRPPVHLGCVRGL